MSGVRIFLLVLFAASPNSVWAAHCAKSNSANPWFAGRPCSIFLSPDFVALLRVEGLKKIARQALNKIIAAKNIIQSDCFAMDKLRLPNTQIPVAVRSSRYRKTQAPVQADTDIEQLDNFLRRHLDRLYGPDK